MADIATLAEVKVLLGIPDTSMDTRITALLPIVTSDIKEYCNNLFVDEDGVETYPAALKAPFARVVAWRMTTYGFAQTPDMAQYPPDVVYDLNKFKKARLAFSKPRARYNDRRGIRPQRFTP